MDCHCKGGDVFTGETTRTSNMIRVGFFGGGYPEMSIELQPRCGKYAEADQDADKVGR